MVKVVHSTETKLADQWSPPLDCPGSVGPHGEASGEHGSTARELNASKACVLHSGDEDDVLLAEPEDGDSVMLVDEGCHGDSEAVCASSVRELQIGTEHDTDDEMASTSAADTAGASGGRGREQR